LHCRKAKAGCDNAFFDILFAGFSYSWVLFLIVFTFSDFSLMIFSSQRTAQPALLRSTAVFLFKTIF